MTTAPPEDELVKVVKELRLEHPSLGALKLLAILRQKNPEWSLSEKRLRKILQQENLVATAAVATLYPVSKIDDRVDASIWTSQVAIKQFDKVKGKGLVAKQKLMAGEILWKEDPWIFASDWVIYSGTETGGEVCTHCSQPLVQSQRSLAVRCSKCGTGFCNRLCLTRAEAYHPLLCSGSNPPSKPFLDFLKGYNWASPHVLARFTARLMLVNSKEAREEEWGHFMSLASWSLKDKAASEGRAPTPNDTRLWQDAYNLYCGTFQTSPTVKNIVKVPIPQSILRGLFDYQCFEKNIGAVNLNRETHGGIYLLHAHLNHTCKPNVQTRHLDNRAVARISIKALQDIEEGEELCVSYVQPSLGVRERRLELKSWGIPDCKCDRCIREEEELDQSSALDRTVDGDLANEMKQAFTF